MTQLPVDAPDKSAQPYALLLLNYLNGRLIHVSSLRRSYQLLIAGVALLSIIIALLLPLSSQLQPQVVTGTNQGLTVGMPLVNYLIVVIAQLCGWTLVLTAATHLPPVARAMIAVLTVIILEVAPVSRVVIILNQSGHPVEVALRIVQAIVVVVAGLWVLVGAWPMKVAKSHQYLRIGGVLLGLLGCYTAADLFMVFGIAELPPNAIAIQTLALPVLLVIFIYWGSADFIEWGETFAKGLATVTAEVMHAKRLFLGITAVIAVLCIVDGIRLVGWETIAYSLIVSLFLLSTGAVLGTFAGITPEWPVQLPLLAKIMGIAFLYLFFQTATFITAQLAAHLRPEQVNPAYTILSVSIAAIVLAICLLLIAWGRRHQVPTVQAMGLFWGMIALLLICLSVPPLANVFGLPVIPGLSPGVPAFKVIVGVVILGALLRLAISRRLAQADIGPFVILLVALVSLQVITWFFFFIQPAMTSISGASAMVATILFLIALLWDFLMSGDLLTNQTSKRYPREARILLYVGYTLIATATVLYFKSNHYLVNRANASPENQSVILQRDGAIVLGIPLIAFLFLRQFTVWYQKYRKQEKATKRGHARDRQDALE
jgi:hypothetical protein